MEGRPWRCGAQNGRGKKKFHLDERDEWKIKRSQEPFIQVEAWAVSEQESNRDI